MIGLSVPSCLPFSRTAGCTIMMLPAWSTTTAPVACSRRTASPRMNTSLPRSLQARGRHRTSPHAEDRVRDSVHQAQPAATPADEALQRQRARSPRRTRRARATTPRHDQASRSHPPGRLHAQVHQREARAQRADRRVSGDEYGPRRWPVSHCCTSSRKTCWAGSLAAHSSTNTSTGFRSRASRYSSCVADSPDG